MGLSSANASEKSPQRVVTEYGREEKSQSALSLLREIRDCSFEITAITVIVLSYKFLCAKKKNAKEVVLDNDSLGKKGKNLL